MCRQSRRVTTRAARAAIVLGPPGMCHRGQERLQVGKDIAHVRHRPGISRCHLERAADQELPDKQEGHQLAPFREEPSVNLLQEVVRAAASRHRRTQLAPDQAVAHHHDGRHDPTDCGMRAAHRRDEHRDRDEGADPDHVGDVERDRLRESSGSASARDCGNKSSGSMPGMGRATRISKGWKKRVNSILSGLTLGFLVKKGALSCLLPFRERPIAN